MYEITNQDWLNSTCVPQYDAIFYDYLNGYDHCNETGISGSSIYGMGDSDFDVMFGLSYAKSQGWIVCQTTTSYSTLAPSSTSSSSGLSVGQMTTWYGSSVQIMADNGDGTYDIQDQGGYMNYSISGSDLSTDINGNKV